MHVCILHFLLQNCLHCEVSALFPSCVAFPCYLTSYFCCSRKDRSLLSLMAPCVGTFLPFHSSSPILVRPWGRKMTLNKWLAHGVELEVTACLRSCWDYMVAPNPSFHTLWPKVPMCHRAGGWCWVREPSVPGCSGVTKGLCPETKGTEFSYFFYFWKFFFWKLRKDYIPGTKVPSKMLTSWGGTIGPLCLRIELQ
jgi:hypothetical protein